MIFTQNQKTGNWMVVNGKEKEPRFGGAFKDQSERLIYITKVIYSEPATVVLWNDGTKTIAKCREGDTYNKETGLIIAVLKKMGGNRFVADLCADWLPKAGEPQNIVSLSNVRKNHNKK